MLTVDLRGTPFLYISGHPYCASVLKPCGHNCWVISSRREDLLRRLVVLSSSDSVLALLMLDLPFLALIKALCYSSFCAVLRLYKLIE